MDSGATTRQLAAILAVDMVGYSRLLQADETGTLSRQKSHLNELFTPKVEEFHGSIVKTTGDGALIEFHSAVNAVHCAIALQDGMAQREAGIPEDRRIVYRMGINLGDIIREDGDIFGSGVNIAARIESIADPGGVFISGNVYEQILDKVDCKFEALGAQNLKNISSPVEVFRVISDSILPFSGQSKIPPQKTARRSRMRIAAVGVIVSALFVGAVFVGPWFSQSTAPDGVASEVIASKPAIAVLPFLNMSNDPDQEYFVDGMTEDLITDLSKISALTVIARTSTFAYKGQSPDIRDVAADLNVDFIVEGSVRKIGDQIRFTAILIEAETGKHLWAERYDRSLDDIFAVQDEVRAQIIAALTIKLTASEERRLARPLSESAEAYDLYLKGIQQESFFTKASFTEATRLFKQAVSLDPSFAAAYAHLAQTYSFVIENDWTDEREEYIKLALESANKAIELDDELPYAYWSLGRIYTRGYASDLPKAIASFEKAIELNQNYADGYVFLAISYTFNGQAERALPLIEKGMQINPLGPMWYFQAEGMAQFFTENHEAAVASFEETIERNATLPFPYPFIIASYAYLGQIDDAEWMAMEFGALGQSTEINDIMGLTGVRDPAYRELYEVGLRKAGLE